MKQKCYIYTKKWDKDKSVIKSVGEMPEVIDRAESYHRKLFHSKNPGGYSCGKKPFGTKKIIEIPKVFKAKPPKPNFIDKLIQYETEGLSIKEEKKFLKEAKDKYCLTRRLGGMR